MRAQIDQKKGGNPQKVRGLGTMIAGVSWSTIHNPRAASGVQCGEPTAADRVRAQI